MDIKSKKKKKILKAALSVAIEDENISMLKYLLDRILPDKRIQQIKAENAKDILQLLSRAQITTTEAADLMRLLQAEQDMQLLPKLMKQLEKLER
jgi:predicted flavoprotein YhiN